jgi:hypothetical protein
MTPTVPARTITKGFANTNIKRTTPTAESLINVCEFIILPFLFACLLGKLSMDCPSTGFRGGVVATVSLYVIVDWLK